MAIIERDCFDGQATTYTINLGKLCGQEVIYPQSQSLLVTGKITLTRHELLRIKDILNSVDLEAQEAAR
jgi:hypothetical protein